MEGIQITVQGDSEKRRSEGERETTHKIARTRLENGTDRTTMMAMTGLTEEDLPRITH